jgi:hypothetical protein
MDKLKSLLKTNDGILATLELNAVGISNERLRLLVKDGTLERVAHGVYASHDVLPDKMYIFQRRRPKLIYSHETALFLHSLTDRNPITHSFDKKIFKSALEKTSQNRNTASQVAEAGSTIGIIETSSLMADLWKRYQKKYAYASNITWSMAMDSVKRLSLLLS